MLLKKPTEFKIIADVPISNPSFDIPIIIISQRKSVAPSMGDALG